MEVRSLVLTDRVQLYEKGNANVTGRRAFKFHLPGPDLQLGCRVYVLSASILTLL